MSDHNAPLAAGPPSARPYHWPALPVATQLSPGTYLDLGPDEEYAIPNIPWVSSDDVSLDYYAWTQGLISTEEFAHRHPIDADFPPLNQVYTPPKKKRTYARFDERNEYGGLTRRQWIDTCVRPEDRAWVASWVQEPYTDDGWYYIDAFTRGMSPSPDNTIPSSPTESEHSDNDAHVSKKRRVEKPDDDEEYYTDPGTGPGEGGIEDGIEDGSEDSEYYYPTNKDNSTSTSEDHSKDSDPSDSADEGGSFFPLLFRDARGKEMDLDYSRLVRADAGEFTSDEDEDSEVPHTSSKPAHRRKDDESDGNKTQDDDDEDNDDDDVPKPSQPRARKCPAPTSNKPSKKQSKASGANTRTWTDEEHNAITQVIIDLQTEEWEKYGRIVLRDVKLHDEVSKRLAALPTPIDRSTNGCKGYWNRYGGERAQWNVQTGMHDPNVKSTSTQKPKSKSATSKAKK